MLHDHTKLDPIIFRTDEAIAEKDFNNFSLCINDCLKELKRHIDWEESRRGILHDIEVTKPNFRAEINELRTDHLYMMNKLQRSLVLAAKADDYAFSIFKQFKLRRNEHVFHEDELDVAAHTVQLH